MRWLSEAEVDPATREDVLLASGEAVANAVEHAYADAEPGTVEVPHATAIPLTGSLESSSMTRPMTSFASPKSICVLSR